MPRPKLEFNEAEIRNYAKLGASNREIADMLGCDEGTIRKRFSALLAKARANRKIKLRELQWKSAEAGNITMQIWLGKQELGQTEKQEIKETSEQKIETKVDLTSLTDTELAELYKKRVSNK